MEISPTLFTQFFKEIHGCEPFPWQIEMAERACAGEWPSPVSLPTAAGKTALIDIAVFTLAVRGEAAPRRLFFVVDRRVIVDEAAERAKRLARGLRKACRETVAGEVAARLRELGGADEPLVIATLRGGKPRDEEWAESPVQPLVCCSTVDQVGSSLLFRAYGARSEYSWPIRAGLAGNDALIILDEAHTSVPFRETLEALRRYRLAANNAIKRPFEFVELSATPGREPALIESERDKSDPVLKARWEASKPARLVIAPVIEGERFGGLIRRLVEEARRMERAGAKVIGVIANRVATARAVHDALNGILLTGRARAFDRDRIWRQHREHIELGRKASPEQAVFVVATQCIEAGANIDFDALVTEAASIDALEQRFGRLNREGRAQPEPAAIVAQKDQTAARYVDDVYGGALVRTWAWLNGHAKKVERSVLVEGSRRPRKIKELVVEMGVNELRAHLAAAADRESMLMARRHAPVLLPAHLDRLCQTSPVAEPSPEISLFLHGPDSGPADVQVLWRADFDAADPTNWADLAALCPPSAVEAIGVPAWAVRKWLAGDAGATEFADIEGTEAGGDEPQSERLVLLWRGPEESKPIAGSSVWPGMTVVAPASYGGCDRWGWNPHHEVVDDIGDEVQLASRARPVLRLKLANTWTDGENDYATRLGACEEAGEARTVLRELYDDTGVKQWVREAARLLVADRRMRLLRDPSKHDDPPVLAICGRSQVFQESMSSSRTVEIALDVHHEGCRRRLSGYAAGLPEGIALTLDYAARLHDIGKADPRFQAWLRGGVPAPPGELLAKSAGNARDRIAMRRARDAAGYPEGMRHELLGTALLLSTTPPEGVDWDLLLHLVASHHGRCRPFAPVAFDDAPLKTQIGGMSASTRHGLEMIDSGIAERFWRLTRHYGWHGLAYLEALLRLTDQRQSEEEQDDERANAAASH